VSAHPEHDCEDCGELHIPWSVHAAARDAGPEVAEMFPGALLVDGDE
jgi:hypothetical protein